MFEKGSGLPKQVQSWPSQGSAPLVSVVSDWEKAGGSIRSSDR